VIRINRIIRTAVAAILAAGLAAPAALAHPADSGPSATEGAHGGRYIGSVFVPNTTTTVQDSNGGRYVGSVFVPNTLLQDKATPAAHHAAHGVLPSAAASTGGSGIGTGATVAIALAGGALLAAGGFLVIRRSRSRERARQLA
jgi:hypothetical protein